MSAHEAVFPTLNLIGAQERDDAITNMFRGFILDVEAWNYNAVEDMPTQNFSSSCNGGCNVCSDRFSGDCHGECEWNEFLNGVDVCERCPDWCREGCWDDGACPVHTRNPFP